MAKKHTELFQIARYDCDVVGNQTLPSMVRMMIKVSGDQSRALGVTDDKIHSLGLGWIITQHDMYINRLPKAGEEVQITTEAVSYNKYFCYRHFWIHDVSGDECVHMKSTFALMDMKERKMGHVADEVVAPFESEKIKRIIRSEKIASLETPELEGEYKVRYLDIDDNQHVNNSVYLGWMMDVLGYDYLSTHEPEQVSIKFNKEVRYGESIHSLVERDNRVSRHQIKVNEDICAEANITWRE